MNSYIIGLIASSLMIIIPFGGIIVGGAQSPVHFIDNPYCKIMTHGDSSCYVHCETWNHRWFMYKVEECIWDKK